MDTIPIVIPIIAVYCVSSILLLLKLQSSNTKDCMTLTHLGAAFYVMCIYAPLFEESVFRYTLRHVFSDWIWAREIISVLFGLMHVQNFTLRQDRKIIIYQIFAAMILGYYLYDLNDLGLSMLVHFLYNFGIIMTMVIYCWCYGDEPRHPCCTGQFVRCNTQDDFIYKMKNCPHRWINNTDQMYIHNKHIRPDMRERIAKLNTLRR